MNFQLLLRFIQGLTLLLALAGIAVAVALTDLSIVDIFAAILAFIPTGWGIVSVSLLVHRFVLLFPLLLTNDGHCSS